MRPNMHLGVSEAVCSTLRSTERVVADDDDDGATDKTSSVCSIAASREVSPSFRKNFMDLQRELQNMTVKNDEHHAEYIRAVESCLLSSAPRVPASPSSGSTACSEDGRLCQPQTPSTNVILVGNEGHNVRLEVALLKLRTGIMGQQKLIRLHQTDTHLELEYSDAIEDMELSYVPLSPVVTNSPHSRREGTSPRSDTRHTFDHGQYATTVDCHPIDTSGFEIPSWVWMTTVAISLAAVVFYYRNRNTSTSSSPTITTTTTTLI